MSVNTSPELPIRLTLSQAAERLGVSTRTIRRKIAGGEIRAVRHGTGKRPTIRVDRDSLLAHEKPMFE